MPTKAQENEFRRRTPVWEVVEEFKAEIRGRERNCLELRCGYCQNDTVVEAARWYKREVGKNNGLTRPCPYCFRASYMPDADQYARKMGWVVNLEGR